MGDTIIGVQFGIANPDEIVSRSVVEVTTDKTYQGGTPVPNGVFDSRFGVIENGKVCTTCKQTNLLCPGHFGHIRLSRPVYLYQFLDSIRNVLQVVCLSCSNPYMTDEQLDEIPKTLTGMDRFAAVRERSSWHKAQKKPDYLCAHCNAQIIKKAEKIENTVASLEGALYDPGSTPIQIQPEMVLRCFQRIRDEHVTAIGFNPKFSRPDWMVCTVLAVPPLTVRPSVVMDDNQRMEDDLTHKLIDIVRNNQRLREKIDKGETADVIDKYTALLQFDVATYVDNDIKGLPPAAQRSGRPLKTLKSRMGAKAGRVRGNLMGKRVDFSARSVITPDANIDVDELGVPEEIATNLTFPEIVTLYNRDRLMGYIRNGPTKYPGAKSVHLQEENRTLSLRYVNPDTIDLKQGDIVHRHLIDNDVVLFNRQPSLHKGSMECHRIKVLPYSTFRLNVSATRPYNADFDGDEMNMHVPQSIAAATELKFLASVLRQIISPRTNSPIIQLFQDTLTGAYRISQQDVKVPEHIGMNILGRMKKPLSGYTRNNGVLTGRDLISSTFPLINFNGSIELKDGKLVKGELKKTAFGGSADNLIDGILHVIYNDFGPHRCGQFINEVQNIVTKYNLYSGFSVGASDLIGNDTVETTIAAALDKGRKDVADIISSVHSGTFLNNSGRPDGEELENQIMNALRAAGSDVAKRIMDNLPIKNRMREIRFKYTTSRVHPGEMVGTVAAQSIGEPTTQLTLNTFHSAGTVKANATQGVPRIIELLSVSHNPKNPMNVIYLNPSVATSQDSTLSTMKEIQKTTLRDITKSVRIYYDPNPMTSNTVVQEDVEILRSYERFSVTQGDVKCVSPWVLRLELDRMDMRARNLEMTTIATRIQNNKTLHVFDCIHSDTNSPDKLILRITFGTDIVKNALSLRFIEDKLLDTNLTGVDGIGRVYIRELKSELTYDPAIGGYTPLKQYVLDAEGTNLLDLSTLQNVDPMRSFSNDVHEIMEVFGIETARVSLYEEFMEVFKAEYVNYHHMITLIDTMTYPGYILSADRFGMSKSDSGVLARSSFEETSKVLFNAAMAGEFDSMKGVSANIMFGQKPPCGTGFVDILIDETKLPEGSEEDAPIYEAQLAEVNTKLDAVAEGVCRVDEIMMEW